MARIHRTKPFSHWTEADLNSFQFSKQTLAYYIILHQSTGNYLKLILDCFSTRSQKKYFLAPQIIYKMRFWHFTKGWGKKILFENGSETVPGPFSMMFEPHFRHFFIGWCKNNILISRNKCNKILFNM